MTRSLCVLVVFFCLAATVLCATPPPGWTCESKYYNENNGCDCNCGVVDPDCQRSYNSLFGCPAIRNAYAYCNATAQCAYDTRIIPESWYCDPLEYHKNDTVCNCGCGAYDPDCKVATSTVVNCHYGLEASCASNGTCLYKAPLPAGWVCSGEFYDSNDGCDCNCGAYDPDCKRQTETLHCPCTEMTCSLSGFCTGFCNGFNLTATPVSNSTSSNSSVTTRSLVTSKDEIIDIIEILPRHKELRGAAPLFDESQKYEAFRFYLRNDFEERPSSETRQKVRELFDANSEDEDLYHLHRRDEVPVPESWTCNESFYNARDGCDCGCGALDPDCEPGLRNQILFGCNKFFTNTSHPYCNAEGKCTPGGLEIPSDWRCFPDSYNATDACDCACGAYDPDCDHMTGLEFVFNCYDGIGPSCKVDGTCNYEIPVPALWNCPKEYFGRQDGCDCGCGVRDPDCDDVENTSIFGCGSCHNATELECVPEGFCIGLCRGYILDYEKLEDYNAQLEPHASKYYLEVKASSGDSPSSNSPSPINFSSSSDASVLSFSISLLAVAGLFAFLL